MRRPIKVYRDVAGSTCQLDEYDIGLVAGKAPQSIDTNHKVNFSQELSAFLARLHRQETGQVVETQGSSGLIGADDGIEVEFDEVGEE
jgi:hypothetical protein